MKLKGALRLLKNGLKLQRKREDEHLLGVFIKNWHLCSDNYVNIYKFQ